jgi:NAD(P)-dependent dehydrogenase (short-subunit alcohol dehydrogenase family)
MTRVVVLTGASSGLGRAAALELSRRGARVVLAARRTGALDELAVACRAEGGDALPVTTDVTDERAVAELASRALSWGGTIDAWVNNAGVTSFGSVESSPLDVLRRVLETNLWGSIYGARAVVPIFRRQGHGVLVNVGSILSKVGQPFVPAYVISKFALHGLSEALRAELTDAPGVQVCTLLPYTIDTPHFQDAANLLGRKPYAMPPVQAPEKVARALCDLIERPRRELHVPRSAVLGLALHALFPALVEDMIREALSRWHFGGRQIGDPRGNLWRPALEPAAVHGQRPPRLSLPSLLGWLLLRYTHRGLRLLAGH